MDSALQALYEDGLVEKEEIINKMVNPNSLNSVD